MPFIIRFSTSLRCHASHTRTTKAIEYNITRLRIMQDISHNGRVWYFCMISVSCINRVVLSLAYISRIRFSHLEVRFSQSFCFEVFFLRFPFCDKIVEPRVRASGIIWRVGKCDDVIVLANWEALDVAQFGQFTAQFGTEIFAPFIVIGKGQSQYGYRVFLLGCGFLLELQAERGFTRIICLFTHCQNYLDGK